MMLSQKEALTNLEWRRIFYWWHRGRRSTYFSVRSTIKDGKMYLPNIPGLPVRVNMEKLEKDGILEGIKILIRQ